MILAGRVRIDGTPMTKPGTPVRSGTLVEVHRPAPYVSRGGEKLEGALDAFGLDVAGATALDVGASTGGFTDCLLVRGAASVTAVDVGYGQLAWRLRGDPRVRVMERANFRLLPDDAFPGGFDAIVVDASFISLRTILARAQAYLREDGTIVALVKPQFEAGRERLGKGGVVRDAAVHRAVLHEMRDAAPQAGLRAVDACRSPLVGPAGNVEFFMRFVRAGAARDAGLALDDARLDGLAPGGGAPA